MLTQETISPDTIRTIAMISCAWAVSGLLIQWISSRGQGRKEFSVRTGSPIRGIIYNFTYAMLPRHKETIRLHPWKFMVGVVMHLGIFVSIGLLIAVIINHYPSTLPIPFLIAALLCGIYLLIRRMGTRGLRSVSSPDDYISMLFTIALLASALLYSMEIIGSVVFLFISSLFFFYFPLGKLRHALFFFIARADYGSRLGYRGIYPPRTSAKEVHR